MAWPNPFRQTDENTRTCWGYTFQWTPDHLQPEEVDRLKHSYDVLADDCLAILDRLAPPPSAQLPRNIPRTTSSSKDGESSDVPPKRDMYALLSQFAPKDEKLGQLWQEVNKIPEWVDWDQIQRGQDVFYRYGGAALTGLAYQSLLGGMGATRVVETLARTGGFSTKVARHRMYETTQHILQCTRSLESIQPGGDGHASSVRVRLLHAAVRRRILTLAAQRPEYYSVEKWGVPINDLDCIATIATFSATLIWLSFPRQGIWLREQEIQDYVALWRLIAHYMGTPTQYFETPTKARAMTETLLLSEIDPSETSKVLANNIIKSLEAQPPSYASRDFLYANARWLNGNELADRLGLGRPSFWYWALVAGQCIFFMSMCYFHRSIPYLDRRKVATLRKVFYAMIVEHKNGLGKESVFEFKYIPEFSTRTEKGEGEETGVKQPGIERRNLKTLIIAMIVLGVLGWFGAQIALNMLRFLARLVAMIY
ncbi:MAG: hypothetical protein M1823_003101 [Watsoniomyces obsoletus]|nr:MAG: hypothetical protein M1823_003101 [Watsoniomyces obsoletus]